MPPTRSEILSKLETTFGYSEFRPLQAEAVDTILSGRDAFVLLPTGGGKSLCYQLPALLMDGLAVVVSPLIALMKDQVDKLAQLGIAATFVNSSLEPDEIGRRQGAVARGEVKLLYVAPERLVAPGFLRLLQRTPIAFFAVDEAHCVSEWGHDFRPEYRELNRLRELFPDAPVAAFTATATERVQGDIVRQLGLERARLLKGSFNRPNLHYAVRPKQATYEQLRTYVWRRRDASGIVYCQSRATTEEVARRLRSDGIQAAAYHAGLEAEERRDRQDDFIAGRVKVVVATIAFGMGIDKPDVRFVIHYDLPKNLEGYYQESGRAGRDGLPSDCILFFSRGDAVKYRQFIDEKDSAAERQIAIRQLRAMTNWAESPTCRREALLRYFDEQLTERPARCCDNCEHPAELADYTLEAQKLLSCVIRTGERFGAAHVIDVLRGEETDRVERFGHARLSTYGIGRDRGKDEWRYLARALVGAGYLAESPDEYRTLTVTPEGNQALSRRATIKLPVPPPAASPARGSRRPTSAAGVAGPPASPAEERLFDHLRALRKRLADERNVPAYVVFPDATLRAMAAQRPVDRLQMSNIAGVGPAKLRDYADPFLAVIATDGPPASPAAPATPPTGGHLF